MYCAIFISRDTTKSLGILLRTAGSEIRESNRDMAVFPINIAVSVLCKNSKRGIIRIKKLNMTNEMKKDNCVQGFE